jgi:hypothetical protein
MTDNESGDSVVPKSQVKKWVDLVGISIGYGAVMFILVGIFWVLTNINSTLQQIHLSIMRTTEAVHLLHPASRDPASIKLKKQLEDYNKQLRERGLLK